MIAIGLLDLIATAAHAATSAPSATTTVAEQQFFTPVTTDADGNSVDLWGVTGLSIGPDMCVKGKTLPNTMFTIMPTTDDDPANVKVLSYPANLMTVRTKINDNDTSKTLELAWNLEVASTATESGIQIAIPSEQLKTIKIGNHTEVQIAEGFTNVETMTIADASVVAATFTGLTTDQLDIRVKYASHANIKVDVPVVLRVERASHANIEAPNVSVAASGASTVGVRGEVSDGMITNASTLSISSGMTGGSGGTGAGIAEGGFVAAAKASTVNILEGDCSNVGVGPMSHCHPGRGNVVVRASAGRSETMQGTRTCGAIDEFLALQRRYFEDSPSSAAGHNVKRSSTIFYVAIIAGLVALVTICEADVSCCLQTIYYSTRYCIALVLNNIH